jgi:hypothetical protein
MLTISNSGYVPITALRCTCVFTFITEGGPKFDNVRATKDIGGTYWHDGQASLPCSGAVNTSLMPGGAISLRPGIKFRSASMRVVIDYSFFGFKYALLRRHQTFTLSGVIADDGTIHWAVSE